MAKRGTYAIRISGLGEGTHDFSFDLEDEFFASFEHSEVSTGKIRAQVRMEKNPDHLALHFNLCGSVQLECDRCLESFLSEVKSEETLFVKTGEEKGVGKVDVVYIGTDDHEIDVGQFMYEFIILSLPVRRIHPSGSSGLSECNQEMIRKLEEHRRSKQAGEAGTDPRWDALKGIIKK